MAGSSSVSRAGRSAVIKDGVLLPTPFVTISVNAEGERGLLGIAFDPNFAINQFVYVYYTTDGAAAVHNRISRFTANGDVAWPAARSCSMDSTPCRATHHNGGAIDFGADGKLYVAVGDNAIGANAQSLSTRHGKMLRFNPDGSIPTDNPTLCLHHRHAGRPNRAIWASGLRNPFTFALNPGGPAPTMAINDVGEDTWEEVNDGIAGANYGWPHFEGRRATPVRPLPASRLRPRRRRLRDYRRCLLRATDVASRPSTSTTTSSPTSAPASSAGSTPRRTRSWDFATGVNSPVDLKVGADGFLYYLARGAGPSTACATARSPPASPRTRPTARCRPDRRPPSRSPPPARRRSPISGSATSANIPGATAASYTLASPQPGDNGARFRVNVANSFGNVFSNEAVLTVTANQPPTATITAPAPGQFYVGGQTIAFAGTGADPEDGARPPSAFTWRVDFHHDTHAHPFLPATSGMTSGTFVIPTTGETAANVWYRLFLTVTDSGGRTHTVQRDIVPRVVRLTLATSPTAL